MKRRVVLSSVLAGMGAAVLPSLVLAKEGEAPIVPLFGNPYIFSVRIVPPSMDYVPAYPYRGYVHADLGGGMTTCWGMRGQHPIPMYFLREGRFSLAHKVGARMMSLLRQAGGVNAVCLPKQDEAGARIALSQRFESDQVKIVKDFGRNCLIGVNGFAGEYLTEEGSTRYDGSFPGTITTRMGLFAYSDKVAIIPVRETLSPW